MKIPCIFPANRELALETGSLVTASSSGESAANRLPVSSRQALRRPQRGGLDVDLPQALGEGDRVEVSELVEQLMEARRQRVAGLDEAGHYVMAEGAVRFELRLVEPLVGGRLVGKIGVQPLVGDELGCALVASHGRLDIEDVAGRGRGRIAIAQILDRPQREIGQLSRAGASG